MGENFQTESESKVKRVPFGVFLSAAALVIGAIGAFWFIIYFVDGERQRDLRDWQVRLGIVSDSRHAAIEQWIDTQYDSLVSLSHNSSLQFYAMDLIESRQQSAGSNVVSDAAAEAQYLANLLTVTAEREGFSGPLKGPEVNANVSRVGEAGIALLDLDGNILVSTRGMPAIDGWLANEVAKLPQAKRGLIDIQLGVSGLPIMGFAVPVFSVQGNRVASDQVAVLLGLRYVADDLYPLLKQPGMVEKTAEGILVRKKDSIVEYLSPLSNDSKLMKLTLSSEGEDLAAGFAIKNPGGFDIKRDYRNQEVLVISRKIIGAPWTLMYKVNRAEALAQSDNRLQTILTVGAVVVFLLFAVIIAAWRYGASIRAERAMEQYRKSSKLFENILKFMRVLADNQPAEIFAVASDGTYTFANRTAADAAGTTPQDMKEKTMTSVIGPVKAKAFGEVNQHVIEDFEKVDRIYHFDSHDGTQICKVSHIPLKGDENYPPSALVVVDDISRFTRDQEIRQNGMRQLARALVVLLDHKDPYSTVHSAIVAKLATAVAREMGLSEDECHTIDLAANLVNLGKAVVPTDMLLKREKLSKGEQKFLSDSMTIASDLVHSVEFGLPVIETLTQTREYWDGSGPHGLKGDQIPLTSRLIAGASALVGLMSARSHRDALTYDEAVQELQLESGKRLGPNVVPALTNFVENQGGMEIVNLIALADGERMSASQLISVIDKVGE